MAVPTGHSARSRGDVDSDDGIGAWTGDDHADIPIRTTEAPPTLPATRSQRPNSNTKECVVLGRTGVYTRALHDDVQKLLRAYEEKDCTDFPTFSAIWGEQDFSMIHFGSSESISREHFMSALYEKLLEYLDPEEKFTVQAGAIYGLYLVYLTQPTIFKKVPIRLTISTWGNIELLYQLGFQYDVTDLIFIIHKLRQRGAFVYVAQNISPSKELKQGSHNLRDRVEKTLIRMEKGMNESGFVPYHTMITDLKTMASHYTQLKADITSVSLAKRASEMVMARLFESKPPDLDLRGVKPIPRFLIPNHSSGPRSPVGEDTSRDQDAEAIVNHEATAYQDNNIRDEHADNEPLIDIEDPLPTFEDVIRSFHRTSSNRDISSVTENYSTLDSDSNPATLHGPEPSESSTSGMGSSEQRPRIATAPLPNIFSQSLLQSATTLFPVRVEDISRRYHQCRVSRQEFAAAGGLPQNDYRFPQAHVAVPRKKWGIRKGDPELPHRNVHLGKLKRDSRRQANNRRKHRQDEVSEISLDLGQEQQQGENQNCSGQHAPDQGDGRQDQLHQDLP